MSLTAAERLPSAVREASLRLDFRSDTITQPTPAMREAMAAAEVGDDVFREDPTVNALEAEAARLFEKEAALFVTSGTQGNLLSLLAQARHGDEAILEAGAHIANYEVGGASWLGGISLRPLPGTRGKLSPEQVAAAIRPDDIHCPHTTLLCLENTHNASGGTVLTVEEMQALAGAAHDRGLRVHVDGARIFNAAVALGVPVADLARGADTLTFCLSKGLSAPVGSLIVGNTETIAAARRLRKLVGGGMRQAGVIAAAGLVALRDGVNRLAEDQRRARRLAEGLAAIPGVSIDLASVQTNIVRFDVAGLDHTTGSILDALAPVGVRVSGGGGPSGVRMVVHRHVDDESVATALAAIAALPRGEGATNRAVYG